MDVEFDKKLINGATFIAINEENKILILKRANNDKYSPNLWCVPGGSLEKESYEECVRREVKEETNLKISKLNFFKSYFRDEGKFYYLPIYFYGNVKGEIKLNHEHQEFKWISKKEIENYDFAFEQKEILLDFYSNIF